MGIGLAGIDYAIQEERNQRAFGQEQRLMNNQMRNQMELNKQGHELQMDMWRKTNYKQQIAMMEKAGLNPALMYKSAGQGGTTGSQTGGGASGGSAPQQPKLDITTILNAKLIKAQAEKLEAETNKIKGVDTDFVKGQLENVGADTLKKVEETSNLKTQGQILGFQKDVEEERSKRAKDGGTIPGDIIGNLLKVAGLDPVNNEAHKNLLLGLFGAKFVTELLKNLGTAYGSAKMGNLGKLGNKGTRGNQKLLDDVGANKFLSNDAKQKIINAINKNGG